MKQYMIHCLNSEVRGKLIRLRRLTSYEVYQIKILVISNTKYNSILHFNN
jgi:hypothetical protein